MLTVSSGRINPSGYLECSTGPHQQPSDPCAIPIAHNTTVPFVYAEYLTWSQQDDYLDFEGDEELQGRIIHYS